LQHRAYDLFGYVLDPDCFQGRGSTGYDGDPASANAEEIRKERDHRLIGLSFFGGCGDGDSGTPCPHAQVAGSTRTGYNLHREKDGVFFTGQVEHAG